MAVILIKRLLIGYILGHLLLGLLLHQMGKGCTLNEHLIAVAFGIAGMAICFSFHYAI